MQTLQCEECRRQADAGAAGWRTYLVYHPEVDEAPFVVTFCPECARREFDEGTGEQTDL